MSDDFQSYALGLTAPAGRHYTVVPSDTVDLPVRPRALYVEGAGNAVLSDGTTTVTYSALVAGQVLPFRAMRVLATGTTASLVAWS